MEVSSDTCFPSLDRCDSRVTFSVEEAAILSQHARLPDQQKEITHLYDHLRSPLYAYLSTLGLVAAEAEEVDRKAFFAWCEISTVETR